MTPSIVSRAQWGARKPESVTLRDPHTLKGVVVHWFGSPRAVKKHSDCAAQLRAVQKDHQAGEFNDIAYNHLVCPHGVVFEGRGFGVQTGANGNETVNRAYAAVCVMIGKGDSFPGECKLPLAQMIHAWRDRGAGKEVRRHGSITGSECPGPDIGKWVDAHAYEHAEPNWYVKALQMEPMWAWFAWKDQGSPPSLRPPNIGFGLPGQDPVPKRWWARYLLHIGRS